MKDLLLRYVIVSHPTGPAVLLVSGETGWTLPFVNQPGHRFMMAGLINVAVRERAGRSASFTCLTRWLAWRCPPPMRTGSACGKPPAYFLKKLLVQPTSSVTRLTGSKLDAEGGTA